MRQETAYFEKNHVEGMPTKIATYFTELPNSIGEKFSQCLSFVGMMVSGFGLAFLCAPNYALILILYMPIFMILLTVYGKLSKGATIAKMQ